jgi:hypothetical protein
MQVVLVSTVLLQTPRVVVCYCFLHSICRGVTIAIHSNAAQTRRLRYTTLYMAVLSVCRVLVVQLGDASCSCTPNV